MPAMRRIPMRSAAVDDKAARRMIRVCLRLRKDSSAIRIFGWRDMGARGSFEREKRSFSIERRGYEALALLELE
jgi:hypothetical protein